MPDPSPTNDTQTPGAIEAIVAATVRILRPLFTWIMIILGVATSLSAILLGGLAMRNHEVMIALFEALAIGAGVITAMVAIGKFREGAGLALLSCALAIGGGAILSEPTLISQLFNTAGQPVVLNGITIRDILLWRVVASMLIGLGALITVWARNPRRSAWYLVRAAMTGIPLLALAGAPLIPAVRTWVNSVHPLVQIGGVIVLFFAVLALASACGHCLIRSLEVGRLRADGSIDPGDSPDAPALAA